MPSRAASRRSVADEADHRTGRAVNADRLFHTAMAPAVPVLGHERGRHGPAAPPFSAGGILPETPASRPVARKGAPVVVAILWVILAIVLAVWLVGLLADVAGNVIHVLLIVALALLIYNLVTGRRAV